ncbi:MAG: DNA double-strand break repair nuclease NurA [Chloroflexi bacterium]|nr:DNA double-strand break repair nuclease NurA [Chloroflexota bacterium]
MEKIAFQISGMAGRIKGGGDIRRRKLDVAVRTLKACEASWQALADKLERTKGRTSWLVPGLTAEGMPASVPISMTPQEYYALASDGSHIDVDRHHSAACYLINIGTVALRYGNRSGAELSNSPTLCYEDAQMVIAAPDPQQETVPVEGALLGAKRAVEECRALAEMVKGLAPGIPAVAMLDGSLILWDLLQQKYPDFVAKAIIGEGMLPALDAVREAGRSSPLALCSYISAPRSKELVYLLRVALCPHDVADCNRLCPDRPRGDRECEAVAGLSDADVLSEVLPPGQRSAVFRSSSTVVEKHYGEHQVCFFYLNVCDEIARIELPLWVAEGDRLVDLAQALVFDQCALGDGYPVALAEAHEKAVLTIADRDNFWRLVDLTLESQGIRAPSSAKSRSKRRPFV